MGTPRQYTPDEDAQLLVPLQQGDLASFETLARKYVKRVFNLAFLLSGDPLFAADATRNTFVAAWREVKSLRSTMHFSTWLVVLLLRECRRLLEFTEGGGNGVVLPARHADDADVTGGGTDTPLQRDLRRYVRSLALEQGVVLILHYVRGYSLERIAGIVQIREDVLLSRLFTAQERLAALLRQGTDVSGRVGDETQPPHAEVRRGFSAYLDNSATEKDKELIRRHLGGCGSCREALAQLEWIAEHLKKLPDIDPPAGLVPAIMEAVRTEVSPLPPPPPGYDLFSRGRMAVVVLIIAAVAFYWYQSPHENGDKTGGKAPTATEPVEAPSGNSRAGGEKGPSAPLPPLSLQPGRGGTADRGVPPRPEATVAPVPSVPVPAVPSPPVQKVPLPIQRQAPPTGSKQSPPSARPGVEALPTLPSDWGDSLPVVRTAPRKSAAPKGYGGETAVLLGVSDHDEVQGDIERAVAALDGTVTGRGYSGGRTILYTRIDADNVMDLMGSLGKIGTLLELPHIPEGASGTIDLTIRW